MKRSEMLSKMASVIINYNEAHCVINRDKAMEMAETILQVQEKLDILPPEYVVDYSPMMTTNAWEPEDD